LLVTGLNGFQGVLLVIAGMLSLAYMMPFVWNGRRLKGFRNMIFLKNIIISLIWSLATIVMPLANSHGLAIHGTEIFFLLARQFFFIYALTVVYDLRDIRSDAVTGLQTLATRFGEKNVHHLALLSLLFFLLLIYFDPGTGPVAFLSLKSALTISALCTALIVIKTNTRSKPGYFTFIVDGAMMLRPLIVMAFALM
jgi:4-hydroxybenzoate polyprenyltransferase